MNGRMLNPNPAIAELKPDQTHGAVEFALRATHVVCALLFLSALAFLF